MWCKLLEILNPKLSQLRLRRRRRKRTGVDPLLAAQDSTPHLHRTHRQQTNKQTQTQVCKKKNKNKKKEESCAELSWGLVVVVIVVVFELFFSPTLVSLSLLLPLSLLLRPTYIHLYNLVQLFFFGCQQSCRLWLHSTTTGLISTSKSCVIDRSIDRSRSWFGYDDAVFSCFIIMETLTYIHIYIPT